MACPTARGRLAGPHVTSGVGRIVEGRRAAVHGTAASGLLVFSSSRLLVFWVSAMARDKIILACGECKNRNYFTTKNKRTHPERVEWKKYCPRCDKHQTHKETK
jgi:large subunit ribosomal protein L33